MRDLVARAFRRSCVSVVAVDECERVARVLALVLTEAREEEEEEEEELFGGT